MKVSVHFGQLLSSFSLCNNVLHKPGIIFANIHVILAQFIVFAALFAVALASDAYPKPAYPVPAYAAPAYPAPAYPAKAYDYVRTSVQ